MSVKQLFSMQLSQTSLQSLTQSWQNS